jgi:hypothetical protein
MLKRAAARLRALEIALPHRVVGSLSVDDLIGGFVTRSGILPTGVLSGPDQETLSRLELRPAFVGVERGIIKQAILGDISSIENRLRTFEDGVQRGPRDDGARGWLVRLDQGTAQIE